MATATPTQPDFTSQSGTAYKTNIDACVKVFMRIAAVFAAHEQSTPGMTVRVEAGYIWDGQTLTEVAAQNTATITAPVTNPRIDRIVVDCLTGAVSVVAGSESASPSAPALPAGKWPVAQVALATSTTAITNNLITDERVLVALGGAGVFTSISETIG